MKQLKTFEDACKIVGVDPKKVIPDFSCYPERHRKSMEMHAEIILIVEAANQIDNGGERWVPDFKNRHEPKYEVWYEMGSSGFRFYDYDYWRARSNVGSRLCFKNRNTAKRIVNQFIDKYNDYLL